MRERENATIGRRVSAICLVVASFVFAGLVEARQERPVSQELPWAAVSEQGLGELYLANGARVYESPDLAAPATFNAIVARGVREDFELSVSVREGDGWTGWISLEHLADGGEKLLPEDGYTMLAGSRPSEHLRYRVVAVGTAPVIEQLRSLELITFDTTTRRSLIGSAWERIRPATVRAQTTPTIVSRAEWAADESWRNWEPTYRAPEKFIVHHTAGSTGTDDSAATVRAIYYYHAQVLGWGDIGYNYLVDTAGRIYEGRFGGDGAIGGHTYDSNASIDYNPGTIGIAILGNYQSVDPVTPAALDSLESLVGSKGVSLGVPPGGSSIFASRDLPNVIGHRDVDQTLCPGVDLWSQLETVRLVSQERYTAQAALQPALVTAAALSTVSSADVSIPTGQQISVWAEFVNTGTTTWRSFDTTSPTLKSESSDVRATGWIDDQTVTRVGTTDANVTPGGTGRFSFSLKAPNDTLTNTYQFYLVDSAGVELAGTRFSITISVTGLPYAGLVTTHTVRPAAFTSTRLTTTLAFENRGTETWKRNEVLLRLYDLGYQASPYRDASWPQSSGALQMNESTVAPGSTAHFSVPLTAPSRSGSYLTIVRLTRGERRIVGSERDFLTRVDSPYRAEATGHTVPPALLESWRFPARITFKNTGSAAWPASAVLAVRDLNGRPSRFADRNWPTDGNFRLNRTVGPGGSITISVTLTPSGTGLFLQELNLVLPDGNTINGSQLALTTRVD